MAGRDVREAHTHIAGPSVEEDGRAGGDDAAVVVEVFDG